MSQTRSIRYFTKDALVAAAVEGNKVGYNRQLDVPALSRDIADGTICPVVFSMVHEHIAGVSAPAHIRAMVVVNDTGGRVMLDLSMDRFNALPTAEVAA